MKFTKTLTSLALGTLALSSSLYAQEEKPTPEESFLKTYDTVVVRSPEDAPEAGSLDAVYKFSKKTKKGEKQEVPHLFVRIGEDGKITAMQLLGVPGRETAVFQSSGNFDSNEEWVAFINTQSTDPVGEKAEEFHSRSQNRMKMSVEDAIKQIAGDASAPYKKDAQVSENAGGLNLKILELAVMTHDIAMLGEDLYGDEDLKSGSVIVGGTLNQGGGLAEETEEAAEIIEKAEKELPGSAESEKDISESTGDESSESASEEEGSDASEEKSGTAEDRRNIDS